MNDKDFQMISKESITMIFSANYPDITNTQYLKIGSVFSIFFKEQV